MAKIKWSRGTGTRQNRAGTGLGNAAQKNLGRAGKWLGKLSSLKDARPCFASLFISNKKGGANARGGEGKTKQEQKK